MPLSAGHRLGPYEIVAPLGAGGMGEVYRAKDTRLDRTVAIKILPPHLSADPQFRERFDREAKAISSLSHPNICALYDVGREADIEFLVLEFLEGESLAARLARGPLPVSDALRIGIEVASALSEAHRHGVIHRDLKPGNVMLTRTGARLLDFGLGKSNPILSVTAATNTAAPTLALPLTAQGSIVGTFQYMAPEQLESAEADARTDIWAFGCLLYEAIAGRRPFDGTTQVSLIGAILERDPAPMSEIRPMTPPALARIVRTCLAKNPDDRFQTAHDLGLQLRWVEEGGSAAGLPAPVVAHRKRHERALWLGAAAIALALGAASAWWLKPAPGNQVVGRFEYALPEGQQFTRAGRHIVAISPDGKRFAYVANKQLYIREMDALEARPVPGTNEDPMEPVFSPDGQWLAYFTPIEGPSTDRPWALKKIALSGGAAVTLAQLSSAPYGSSWAQGTILFALDVGAPEVQAVADSGGVPRTLARGDAGKERFSQPQLLDDNKHLLLVVHAPVANYGQIVVQALDGTGRRTLVSGGTDPRIVATGQLLYIHNGVLLAVPFDGKRLAVTGGPIPVVEGISENRVGQFAVSSEGTLVFIPGGAAGTSSRTLVWVGRTGHEQPMPAKPRAYAFPRFSPDGKKIAVSSADEEHDIWIFDLEKETLTRLTSGPGYKIAPIWTPDGRYVFFASGPNPGAPDIRFDVQGQAADGTGTAQAWTDRLQGGFPQSVASGGKSLVYYGYSAEGTGGLYLLPLDPKGPSRHLLPGFSADISPDGRWIAYDSDESGRREVYVRPFPAVDSGRWQISTEGGRWPFWSRSGRELFFLNAKAFLEVAEIRPGAAFDYSKPQPLFDASAYYQNGAAPFRQFDISPDDKRFLVVKSQGPTGTGTRRSLVIVQNWFAELKARMSGG